MNGGIIKTKDGAAFVCKELGGPGSGNFGHGGVPGQRGGSSSGGGGGGGDYGRKILNPTTDTQHDANVQYHKDAVIENKKQSEFWQKSLKTAGVTAPIGPEMSIKNPTSSDLTKSERDISQEIEDAGEAVLTVNEDYNDGSYEGNEDVFVGDMDDATNNLNYWLAVGEKKTTSGFNRAVEERKEFKENNTKSKKSSRKNWRGLGWDYLGI